MTRKKTVLPDAEATSGPVEPVAVQTHVVTTRYKKEIPVSEVEQSPDEDAGLIEPEIYVEDYEGPEIPMPARPAPTIEAPLGANDSIAQMLADLQIEKRSHSWTMVVERLPNYDRDGRGDVGAKRVNCGTRAMSMDFIEEIRREFARPGKPNHFRVTVKRDGKIFAHWPDVISLEPPAPDELPALDAQFAPAPPVSALAASAPPPGLSDLVKQLKQLKEIQALLSPEPIANPAVGALTEEAALLRLLSSSDEVISKVTERISKKLFRDEQPSEGAEWLPLVKSVMDHGPAIVAQIFQGIQQMRAPAQAPPMAANPAPLPPPVSPQQPTPPVETGPAPELVLLGNVIRYLEINAPVEAAATFVDAYTEQNPGLNPLIDSFLAMSPDDCRAFMQNFFPQAAPILNREGASDWLARFQKMLSTEDVDK